MYVYMCVYIYIFIYIYMCVCIYIYLNHWAVHQKLTHNIVNQLHTSVKKKKDITDKAQNRIHNT